MMISKISLACLEDSLAKQKTLLAKTEKDKTLSPDAKAEFCGTIRYVIQYLEYDINNAKELKKVY